MLLIFLFYSGCHWWSAVFLNQRNRLNMLSGLKAKLLSEGILQGFVIFEYGSVSRSCTTAHAAVP